MVAQRSIWMDPLLWPLRSLANGLGVAWWARVETREPAVVYWYGPFLRREELQRSLSGFLADLKAEAPGDVSHELLRTRRGEPLTEVLGPD
jgi:hypothetical protein